MPKFSLRLCSAVALLFALPQSLPAQAWTPAKGEGDFTFTYQNLYTADHFRGDGSTFQAGKIRLEGFTQTLDFGITDRLAFTFGLPYGIGKYSGGFPHQLITDDGDYHGALQDYRLGLRYNLTTTPVVFTPFITGTFPTHDYTHFAHSAIGSDMWEILMGAAVGKQLDRWIPKTYVQASYSYAVDERVLNIRPNRSRAFLEMGYFLSKRWTLRGLAGAQVTHSGLDFPQDFPPPSRDPSNPLWFHHDQIGRVNYLYAGGGFDVAVSPSISLFYNAARTVWGENGHKLNFGQTAGMSFHFRTPWARPQLALVQPNPEPQRASPRDEAALVAPLCHH